MFEAKKHSSEIIDSIQNRINPIDFEKTEVRLKLSLRIYTLMKDKNWTKSEFAKIVKTKPSVITRWLSGTHNFTTDTLTEICNAFKIELSKLFDFKNEQLAFKGFYELPKQQAQTEVKYIHSSVDKVHHRYNHESYQTYQAKLIRRVGDLVILSQSIHRTDDPKHDDQVHI